MSVPQFSVEPHSVLRPGSFNDDSDQWHAELPGFIDALNALGITGGVMAMPCTFSTTTADADPGDGMLRLNHATQNLATVARVDLLSNAGADWTAMLNSFDDSTSTVKGQLGLVDLDDGTKFLIFNVTAVATPAGYRNITIAHVGGSAASPFADGAALLLTFTRTGDKGETGATGAPGADGADGADGVDGVDGVAPGSVVLAVASAANSATIDFTGIDSTYDEYELHFQNVIPSTAASLHLLASKDAGANFITTSSYYTNFVFVNSSGSVERHNSGGTTAAQSMIASGVSSTGSGASGVIRIHGPSSTRYMKTTFESVHMPTSHNFIQMTAGGVARCDMGSGFTCNALRLMFSAGDITSGTFQLVGLRKAV